MPLKILIIEDEPTLRIPLADDLSDLGHEVLSTGDGESGLDISLRELPDVVLCDVRLPGRDGLSVLRAVHARHPGIRFVIMTAFGSVNDAVDALKDGAWDYLTKPFEPAQLVNVLHRIEEERGLRDELARARRTLNEMSGARGRIVGSAPIIQEALDRIRVAAGTDIPILLIGESGTGKTVFARLIHELSTRKKGSFVALNCATIPRDLFESELFGHERGAFTGAVRRQTGKVARANRGTLFLDEVGEIPLSSQPKLLHFLDSGIYEPVGGAREERADVRLVAATNRDLGSMVSEGGFREDLLFRINAMEICIPPVRERREDIPVLLQHFLDDGTRQGLPSPASFSTGAWELLCGHDYPGNVRELRNVVQHLMVVSQGGEVLPEHLPARLRASRGDGVSPASVVLTLPTDDLDLARAVATFESAFIRRTLRRTTGSRTEAAQILGISRKNLWEKMKRLEITSW